MTVLIDRDIARPEMISPFHHNYIPGAFALESQEEGTISHGLSSCGYDLTLGTLFATPEMDTQTIDPKRLRSFVEFQELGPWLDLEPGQFLLGHSKETITMPDNLVGLCVGKSTYARCGILVNTTPIEPGWEGQVTIEINNLNSRRARIYIGEGIAQVLFFRLNQAPTLTYRDKVGKYQNQTGVTLARV